jgi:lysophospholipase L1-like esterase
MMRVTITKAAGVYSQYGILMPQGSINTVGDDFGKSLISSLQATDTDGVLTVAPNRPYMNSPPQLPGTYLYASLPAASAYPVNTQAYTSDAGSVTSNGLVWVKQTGITGLQTIRANNIAAYLLGPMIPAPAWVAATPYVAGNAVTLPSGQHMVCATAGTSAGSVPVYSATVLTGRPLVDNTVTWQGMPYVKSLTDASAPVVTSGASAAAVGLTETKFVSGASTVSAVALAGSFGAVPVNHLAASSLGRYAFAVGPAAGSGNATAFAVTDGGQSAAFVYQNNNCDLEFYVTDAKFGIVMSSSVNPTVVEIDGQLVQGNPTPGTGAGWCIAFDYGGLVKRRRVRLANNSVIDAPRGVALSTIGFMEPTDSPVNDTLLILGDSISMTILAGGGNGLAGAVGGWISKILGMTAVINCAIGGSGYVSVGSNSFTTLQTVQAAPNQALFAAYNPGHVLIASGFNDRATGFGTVGPAALATWQAVRALLPNAKISITDGYSQASGPDANGLAQAVSLATLFTTWNDGNSRFIQSIGPSASTAWIQGTNNSSQALQLGNSCNFVGSDGVHPNPAGAFFLATRMALAIKNVWNNQY